jgi:hypothetical protein
MELDADSLLMLFDQLDYDQQNEAVDKINAYLGGDESGRRRMIRESRQRNQVRKMHLGPTGRPPCPLCGR